MRIVYPTRIAIAVALASTSFLAGAQELRPLHEEERIEEIIVTGAFAGTRAETMLPITVLSGEELREKVTNSLGDTLKNELGVHNASFGAGVGQPILRGQTGNRVAVLQNSVSITDASSLSPDHANATEPLLALDYLYQAPRDELVRGVSFLVKHVNSDERAARLATAVFAAEFDNDVHSWQLAWLLARTWEQSLDELLAAVRSTS